MDEIPIALKVDFKTCPFCGWAPDWAEDNDGTMSIYCPNEDCGMAHVRRPSRGQAIRAWQHRTTPTLHDFCNFGAADAFNAAFFEARKQQGKTSREAAKAGLTAAYHWAARTERRLAQTS